MASWRKMILAIGFSILGGAAVFIGCTRQIAVPVNPAAINSNTDTPSSTPTVTLTNTPTITYTPTVTNTVSGPTNTMTATGTPTNTFTLTQTSTATSTPTNTATVTPTPMPTWMIADFEEGGTADVTGNSLGLSGVWYEVGSAGTSPAPPASLTPSVGGCGASSAGFAEVTGTTGSTTPIYAALQGDFLNPAGPYNITTNAPGANAFVFCIKGTAPGGQVFFAVSDNATTESSDNAGKMIPITSSWQSVTVCFNHMQSQGFGVTTVGHMFDPTTAQSFSWKVTTASSAFDISVDNFQLIPGATCPAFTATPTPNPYLIDNMEDGDNQIAVMNGRNGYWYCYSDLGNSGTIPAGGIALSASTPITVVPGETAASNPLSIQAGGTVLTSGTIPAGNTLVWGISTTNTGNGGVSQFTSSNGAQFVMASPGSPTSSNDCAYYTGAIGYGCSAADFLGAYSECPFAGMGFNFIDNGTGPKQVYALTSANLGFTPNGISFYAKVDASSATGNWWFFLPTSNTDCPTCDSDSWGFNFTPTTSWTQYGTTTPFTGYAQAFSDGGADGAAVSIANAYGCKWQNTSGSSSYGLYVDDVYFY